MGFVNPEDILLSCLKDIRYNYIKNISKKQLLEILQGRLQDKGNRDLGSIFSGYLSDALKMLDLQV